MNPSANLYRLQKIDSSIDDATGRIKQIDFEIEADKTLSTAQKNTESAEISFRNVQSDLRTKEYEVSQINLKIQQSQNKLYSGNVKNPKELQDLQTEMASLKRRLADLEDEQLEFIFSVEEAEVALKIAKKQLIKAKSSFSTTKASLLGEKSALERDLKRLAIERNAVLPSIDNRDMETYNSLRIAKKGLAVSKIDGSSCGVCGAQLPPALKQNSRISSEITFCPTCKRILYAN